MSSGPVILTTPEQLRELVRDAVREELDARERDRKELADSKTSTDWIGLEEAASMIGCVPDYVRRHKGVPVHYVGRKPRFSRTELAAWIRNRPRPASKKKAA